MIKSEGRAVDNPISKVLVTDVGRKYFTVMKVRPEDMPEGAPFYATVAQFNIITWHQRTEYIKQYILHPTLEAYQETLDLSRIKRKVQVIFNNFYDTSRLSIEALRAIEKIIDLETKE